MGECGLSLADLQQVAEALVTLVITSGVSLFVLGYFMADPLFMVRFWVRARRLFRLLSADLKGDE